MDGLTEGRIVHFVLPNGDHRPAIVVRVWTAPLVNLQVFIDGTNDHVPQDTYNVWQTSIPFNESGKPGTWHWIERA